MTLPYRDGGPQSTPRYYSHLTFSAIYFFWFMFSRFYIYLPIQKDTRTTSLWGGKGFARRRHSSPDPATTTVTADQDNLV